MYIDDKQFRQNAIAQNLCSEYTEKWDNCHSKKQLIDMMLGAKGVDYVADSIAKGWGISPSVLSKDFSSFNNGRYVREEGGYTSKFYCQYKGRVVADTTIILLVDSSVEIDAPSFMICEFYCTGKCDIKVSGEGQCVFVCYGDADNINIQGKCGNMKRLNKKERDNYG